LLAPVIEHVLKIPGADLLDMNSPAPIAANEEKEMLFKVSAQVRMVFALALVAGFVGLTLSLSPGVASASSQHGNLHALKDCTDYTGAAGDHCTISKSNLKAIPAGSRVVYASAMAADGSLDSDITLVALPGNTAVGHCTLNSTTLLCTFSGGTGELAGFTARLDVSPPRDGVNWHWDGPYSFDP
jgi:hypothetical protein